MSGHAVTYADVLSSAAEIRARSAVTPRLGVFVDDMPGLLSGGVSDAVAIPCDGIPGFAHSEPDGDPRALVLGGLEAVPVAVLERKSAASDPRFVPDSAGPVRVLRELGAEILVVAGTAAALNSAWAAGELAVLSDHINLLGDSPLVGPSVVEQGLRFPDMTEPYDAELRRLAHRTAAGLSLPLREGVLVGLRRPDRGTSAERRTLSTIGADLMGTFAVPEVIVARQVGLRVLALCVIAAARADDAPSVEAEESREEAARELGRLVRGVVAALPRAR